MGLGGDERGQAMQVGAVILFGFLVVAMSAYQASVVPAQNEEVEFAHSQEVQAEFESVRNSLLTTANAGTGRPVAISLGARYPARTFFVNPPPASGTIRTEATDDPNVNVTVDGMVGAGEAGDFWDGSRRTYDTGFLAYEPAYAEYGRPPTTRYEHTVLYDEFANGHRSRLTGGTLVDGRRIHLVVLDGSLRESGVGTYSVTPRPLSVSTNTVTVTNGSGATLTFATRLDAEAWRGSIDGEFASVSVEEGDPYNTATVSLTDATYELRLSRVGVGTVVGAGEPPAYLTVVDPLEPGLTPGRSDTVTLEVRDRYDNPVSGVAVSATNSSTLAVENPLGNRSDGNGRVSYTVTPTESGSANLSLAIGDGSDPRETVSYVDRRVSTSGGGGGGSPTASFVVAPSAPKVNRTVTFDASGSTDDGTVASYEWTFGDETTATGQSASHAYDSSGTYEVTLTATDDEGNTDTHAESVTVTSDDPSSLVSPSDYRDGNGGPAIPPADPVGTVSAFDNMQADTGQSAQLDTQWDSSEGRHEMRVGVETTGVRNGEAYEFHVEYYTGYAAEVLLVDEFGTVLQSKALPAPDDSTATVSIGLNRAATGSVESDGTLYAVYRYDDQYRTTLYVYSQRVATYD